MQSWYSIENKADESADVMIYDEISAFGISAKDFVADLKKIDSQQINLHINSPGGNVFDGVTIYNALKKHKANVTTYVDGVAASIASIIAIAGDEVRMAKNAYMMMHNPYAVAIGDSETMQKMADMLDKLRNTLAQTYSDKSGKPTSEMLDMMSEETWLTADEAVEAGLADTVDEEAGTVKAEWGLPKFFNNIPRPLKRRITSGLQSSARAVEVEAALTHEVTMDATTFKAYAAEHPDAVASYIAEGKKAGQAESRTAEIARMTALNTVCKDRPQLAIDSFIAGRDAEEVKATVTALDSQATQARAELDAKDKALKEATDKLAAAEAKVQLVGGQAAIGTGLNTTVTIDTSNPKSRAESEWDKDPKVRAGFSSKENYVAYREGELSGAVRIYSRKQDNATAA